MTAYIIRRLLLIIPTVFIMSTIIFFAVRFIPGDIVDVMMSEMGESASPDARANLEHALGLDVPIHIQYGRWIGNIILHGDLGKSVRGNVTVGKEIADRLPITFELGILAILVGLLISFPIGIYSGIRQDTTGDYVARSFAILCIALPSFWIGVMVMVFPSIWWGWSPNPAYIPLTQDPIGNLVQFIIPAAILGMALSGVNMRMVRTMMLEVLRQDYVRTAWSKGLNERVVVGRHALKNALIPVITIIGLQMPVMIGGAVIIEQIFCLPGIGSLTIQSATQRDYPVLLGIILVFAVAVLIINLFIDLTYGFLEPRVRYQ